MLTLTYHDADAFEPRDISRLLVRIRGWLERRGFKLHYVWVAESAEMVRRYAHLAADHLALYADRLCTLREVEESADGTNVSQRQKGERATSL